MIILKTFLRRTPILSFFCSIMNMVHPALIDCFGRQHTYLRVSLTEHCNFRCTYCVASDEPSHQPSALFMLKDEVIGITEHLIQLGIQKVRFTGGEPLMRKDAGEIIQAIAKHPIQTAITTNGYFLDRYIPLFHDIGLRSINISLDSLQKNIFENITGHDAYDRVMNAIDQCLSKQFHLKINMVVLRGENDHEISSFIEWTRHQPVHLRFIEFMPFRNNEWEYEKVYTDKEILQLIKSKYPVEKLEDKPGDTARAYKIPGFKGTFAVISTVTNPFCSSCNRLRLTADGHLRNCLFSKEESSLLFPYRQKLDLTPIIAKCVSDKHPSTGGQDLSEHMDNRSMIRIGG